ncbi:ABC transporter ATPase [Polaribacter sp.]|nr:ABC transporter ATPase [Polaribacter sp.]
MFTDYNNLPENARIWVYQAARELTDEEVLLISNKAVEFIEQWTRHGDDLKGSFIIKYNQFLVFAVDESFNNVSGCSIDASVRFVQGLENELHVDFMDKMKVTFKDGDNINIVALADFQKFAKANKIHNETIVFNNMVTTKKDFDNKWEIPAKESWHKRFLV